MFEFDPNNLVNQASNVFSSAIATLNPQASAPNSTPAPAPGTVAAGQPQAGGTVASGVNTTYVYIGIALLAVVVIGVIVAKK